MNHFIQSTAIALLFVMLSGCGKNNTINAQNKTSNTTVGYWLTNGDKSALFQKQPALHFGEVSKNNTIIEVNSARTFQGIDGFGYCLNGGSAQLISKMGASERATLLKELFATNANNLGISVLRLSIGASDLDDRVFSYNDLPAGETDSNLTRFSLSDDHRTGLIPVLKEILAINPNIMILGSPWSAPVWMKTNNSTRGGSLKPEYYDAYARYFVKYIQGMKAEGITIHAITIQNEPLHPGNNPSMYMEAKDQAIFIKNHLGPVFQREGIKTKIIVYDHNCDKPEYPLEILNDPAAKKYVDGSAFHLYGGKIEALSTIHNAHPDKNVYFTEQWTGGPGDFPQDLKWNVENLIIGASRNWSKMVLQWNLAADPNYDPHTDQGGCTSCMGAITIDGSTVTRNPAYYIIGHASKFVRPGSIRIDSTIPSELPNAAFTTPEGKTVLVVLNTGNSSKDFTIRHNGKDVNAQLNSGSVATFIW